MSFTLPAVPRGNGSHPIALVVITASDLAASSAFYSNVFGWQLQPMSPELTGAVAPAGPACALRTNLPADFPGIVPYLNVPDVDEALAKVLATGATVERAAWSIAGVGKLARFKDSSGTVYGLTDALTPIAGSHIPMPLGSNPKPPPNSVCSLEMYATSGASAARFFEDLFGWGSLETMPGYMAFDPGLCIGGVFQSHTPAMPALAYIYAADVAAKLTEIQTAGGQKLGDAMQMPGAGCFGYFKDPSGTAMGLIGP